MSFFLCIHGHFYQPPRENPWTEEIDRQPSAAPYSNWNERIAAECYAPNAEAKLSKSKFKVNNYENINFNFGPTLVNWMRRYTPGVLKKIVAADQYSLKKFKQHGNAIAQVYNHIIMPLASELDQKLQIYWGLYHFEKSFRRKAEGLWLSETAISMNTVRLLINAGVKYIILSPTQARKIRPIGGKASSWQDVSNNNINIFTPYRIFDRTSSPFNQQKNSYIDVFFYDGPLSVNVSFNEVLSNAEYFGEVLRSSYRNKNKMPQLLSIATDGEVYGHHKKFGEMALAYLFANVLEKKRITPTNYAAFLTKYPPQYEVVLKDGPVGLGTAWSCSHGVGRWYRDCGCATGGGKNWNQAWRTPLREALNNLKQDLNDIYFLEAAKYLKDPLLALFNYIEVLYEFKSNEAVTIFLSKYAKNGKKDRDKILSLMEMQHCGLLMFTSCGWFFNDISGIETIQILAYAAKAIEYAKEFTNFPLETNFINMLQLANSNIPTKGNGAKIYLNEVKPLSSKEKKRYPLLATV